MFAAADELRACSTDKASLSWRQDGPQRSDHPPQAFVRFGQYETGEDTGDTVRSRHTPAVGGWCRSSVMHRRTVKHSVHEHLGTAQAHHDGDGAHEPIRQPGHQRRHDHCDEQHCAGVRHSTSRRGMGANGESGCSA